MKTSRATRIGVIADTHGLFDPMIERHFKGVACIVHAGDIGNPSVVRRLEAIAPVIAVSGNVDEFEKSGWPRRRVFTQEGLRIAVRHVLYEKGRMTKEAQAWLDEEQPDICIFGHTHQPKVEWYGKTLLINPGSAGPKRFTLPRGIGLLTISTKKVLPRLIRLGDKVKSIRMNKHATHIS